MPLTDAVILSVELGSTPVSVASQTAELLKAAGTNIRQAYGLDLEYLREWSPWLDLKILFRSLNVVWSDYKSAY